MTVWVCALSRFLTSNLNTESFPWRAADSQGGRWGAAREERKATDQVAGISPCSGAQTLQVRRSRAEAVEDEDEERKKEREKKKRRPDCM